MGEESVGVEIRDWKQECGKATEYVNCRKRNHHHHLSMYVWLPYIPTYKLCLVWDQMAVCTFVIPRYYYLFKLHRHDTKPSKVERFKIVLTCVWTLHWPLNG